MPALPTHPGPAADPSVVCPPCARCCKHVAVGVDAPTTVTRVSTLLWFVYHDGVSLYQSQEGDWFLNVPASCENLRPDGLCGVYESRPLLCREYDVAGCEGTSEEPAEKLRFDDAAAFVAWLAARRPSLYRRCVEGGIVPERLRAARP